MLPVSPTCQSRLIVVKAVQVNLQSAVLFPFLHCPHFPPFLLWGWQLPALCPFLAAVTSEVFVIVIGDNLCWVMEEIHLCILNHKSTAWTMQWFYLLLAYGDLFLWINKTLFCLLMQSSVHSSALPTRLYSLKTNEYSFIFDPQCLAHIVIAQ